MTAKSATDVADRRVARGKYFLPYQARWLKDHSRFKIAKKSRRVGLTYAQSYEDVRDASASVNAMDVWFSSADESAAKEYILYCVAWANILGLAAADLGEIVIDEKAGIKALTIEFANGKRINALSSNAKAFRSKGGKLVLDEFAFHGDQDAMWKAARPIITWGFPVRIISTFNGKSNRYYRMVTDAEKAAEEFKKAPDGAKAPLWSLHSIDIHTAVAEGLADRLKGKPLSQAERDQWLAEEEEACGDDDTWKQEYCCDPIDSASAWLPWEDITACESADAGKRELWQGGPCYLGWDVARRKHKSVLWVYEMVGDVRTTRQVVTMLKMKFAEQLHIFGELMRHFDVRRACIDETGLGAPIVEQAQTMFGEYRVEGVVFTPAAKQHLATHGKQLFEDRLVRTPIDVEIRKSHHSVRKVTTVANNVRFDSDDDANGHADEFWAHMLALHAGQNTVKPAGADVPPDRDAQKALPDSMGRPGSMFGEERSDARSGRQRGGWS